MAFSNKISNDKKEKESTKRGGLKINNIILKRIKESLIVTHKREKWVWTKNGI